MRLDKFLADMGLGSRKEVKGLIKKGTIEVNGQVVKSDKAQVNEFEDAVTYLGEIITYQKDFYKYTFVPFRKQFRKSFCYFFVVRIFS